MKYVSIIQPIGEPITVYCDNGQVEELKELYAPLLVMPNGESVYLNQKQIDLLSEFANEEIEKKIVEHINASFDSIFGRINNETDN